MTSVFAKTRRYFRKTALWLCLLLGCSPLATLAQQTEDERSWSLGLALGQGEGDNPLISGESIDINAVIDFSWYGERFFFDNGDFGYALGGDNTWSVNLIATFNNERNYYNYLIGRTFGLDSVLDNRLGLAGSGSPAEPGKEDPRAPPLASPEKPTTPESPAWRLRNTSTATRSCRTAISH